MPFQKLLTVILFFSISIAHAQNKPFLFYPEKPTQGATIHFTYNPVNTALAGLKKIEAVVYLANTTCKAKDVPLNKTGQHYTGSFKLDTTSSGFFIVFSSGNIIDINTNEGYASMVYNKGGNPVIDAPIILANFYNYFGNRYAGIDIQPTKSLSIIEKEWIEHPELHSKFYATYTSLLSNVKKKEAAPEILPILSAELLKNNLTEADYSSIASVYDALKYKTQADSLRLEKKKKFPNGIWKKEETSSSLLAMTDPQKMEEALIDYIKRYPPITKDEKGTVNYIYSTIASFYAAGKENANLDKYMELAQKLPAADRADLFNRTSWYFARKDTLIGFCEKISKLAIQWTKEQIIEPTEPRPDDRSKKQWIKDLQEYCSMYANTYATVLLKQKKYSEGVKYAKQAAEFEEMKDAAYNETYAMLLEKTATPKAIQSKLEMLVAKGNATKETITIFRKALIKNLSSTANADAYLNKLTKTSSANKREALFKTLLNEEAPLFTLKNSAGATISLLSLKGKIVVVDFWATWCGPCKASFPAMQKAVDKYKDNPNIVFVFINSFEGDESFEERKKGITSFMAQNKYTFNVLYDEKSKDDPDTYKVAAQYKVSSVPTKFIIDGFGKIRFKVGGYSDSDDEAIEEITAMIDMLISTKKEN